MKQSTLDGSVYRPRKRYKEKYQVCSRPWCNAAAEPGSELCVKDGIDHIFNYHYGLDEFIIPALTGWSAHEYYKILRKRKAQKLLQFSSNNF